MKQQQQQQAISDPSACVVVKWGGSGTGWHASQLAGEPIALRKPKHNNFHH